jgi:hypothetical protein
LEAWATMSPPSPMTIMSSVMQAAISRQSRSGSMGTSSEPRLAWRATSSSSSFWRSSAV